MTSVREHPSEVAQVSFPEWPLPEALKLTLCKATAALALVSGDAREGTDAPPAPRLKCSCVFITCRPSKNLLSCEAMNAEAAEKLHQTDLKLLAKIYRLEARCEALEGLLYTLGPRVGFSVEQLQRALQHVTEQGFQQRLELAEDIDPGMSAQIDPRPPLGDG